MLPVSAIQGEGLEGVWSTIAEYRTTMETAGLFVEKRRNQRDAWMWSYVEEELLQRCDTVWGRGGGGGGDARLGGRVYMLA